MSEHNNQGNPFEIKDCALVALATGKRAHSLNQLLDLIERISLDSIYYHFWGGRLRAHLGDLEYHNDFATWAHDSLHDKTLAERLSIFDPTEFASLEDLRHELMELIEEHLDLLDYSPTWTPRDKGFEFLRSQIVVFDTHQSLTEPQEMAEVVPRLSLGSVFYHFIDARRRSAEGNDDFSTWIASYGSHFDELVWLIREIDPYFSTLDEMREELASTVRQWFKWGE